jgi:lipopolysaccharide/colanic/teichoic acid biosynthesis glycosyltransferase
MEFTDRDYLDMFYIEHRSLWLVIQIIVRTIFAVFMQRGAH